MALVGATLIKLIGWCPMQLAGWLAVSTGTDFLLLLLLYVVCCRENVFMIWCVTKLQIESLAQRCSSLFGANWGRYLLCLV